MQQEEIKALLENNNFRNSQNYIISEKIKINSLNFAYKVYEKGNIFHKKKIYLKDIITNKHLNNNLNIGEKGYVIFSNKSFYGMLGVHTDSIYFILSQILFFGIMYLILGDIIFKELGEIINFMLILIIIFLIFGFFKFFYYKIMIKNYIFYKSNIRKNKIIIYRYK